MENRTRIYGVGSALGIAIVLLLFGLLFLLGNQGKASYLLAGLLMVGLGIGLAVLGVRVMGRAGTFAPGALDERIRNLASLSGGELTAAQVSETLQVPTTDAYAALERLVSKGLAEHKVRGDDLYYTFLGPT